MKIKFIFFFLCVYGQLSAQYADNSVLSQGLIYKIAVAKTGLFKISGAYLKSKGLDLAAFNPKNIHIFGNGGGMLPQENNILRPDDLKENAILVSGEEDNQLSETDYILFYAQGSDSWSLNLADAIFEHKKNIYADTNFYFLKLDNAAGLRIQNQENQQVIGATITQFDDYGFYEKDERNILNSGREWFGERFDAVDNYNVDFDVNGIIPNSTVKISSFVMARDSRNTAFNLTINGNNLATQNISTVGTGTYDIKGDEAENTFSTNSSLLNNSTNLRINVKYDKKGGNGVGHLNYLRINFKRALKLYGSQTAFRSIESLNHTFSNFILSEASNDLTIWDISNPLAPFKQSYSLNGTTASFGTNTSSLKEFITFKGSDFPEPLAFKKIDNQNLHAAPVPHLLIVTASQFRTEAERLAAFRRSFDGLSVLVATTEQIYNEFSSGRQDISAIRDFAKMLYQKNNSQFKYLLLFGDASFDYKNRLQNKGNYVPIYESRESLHPIYSYSSDDYFGFLEDNEGDWQENGIGDHSLEIGIGRLPVKNAEEARKMVDKLIYYSSNPDTFGEWRNKISFVADDGDGNTHQQHAEQMAEKIESKQISFNNNKLFLDAFEQISLANGERSPELKEALNQAVEKGSFILNYTGHGGEVGWTEEKILEIEQIRAWENLNNMPLFVTATCEFGRYDDPNQVSGAEEAALNPKGGAIALITTTRPVFASTNLQVNEAFYEAVFTPINGEMPRLGDVMRITKNESLNGSINRNFALLGDPSMLLAYPQHKVIINKINGKTLGQNVDTLKALQTVKIEGEVQGKDKQILPAFNGTLYATVYDKLQTALTKGTAANPMQYKVRNIILFKGLVTVKEGKFAFEFTVPKDIQYNFGSGKIAFYAKNENSTTDANGASLNLIIGGSFPNNLKDNTPPQIQLFMNDESFVSGGVVDKDATLIAKLSDENGINISQAGIGHDITLLINAKEEDKRNLNEFYTADLDTYKKGRVIYPLKNLPEGKHTIRLKAWDTYNNSAESSLDFVVAEEKSLVLSNVFNYPNPFNESTKFVFEHNKAGKGIEVFIDIFNASGQKIKTLKNEFLSASYRFEIDWDGLDSANNQIKSGLYFYKLRVRSLEDNSSGYALKKMIIIR